MHDVLECVVKYELALIIKKLISEKYFTLDQLNNAIMSFKYGPTDVKNKPCMLPKELKSIGGNASKNWCLVSLLPLIIGRNVPKENLYWKFLLHLKKLLELIFAPRYISGMLVILQEMTIEHIEMLKELFPSFTVKPNISFSFALLPSNS